MKKLKFGGLCYPPAATQLLIEDAEAHLFLPAPMSARNCWEKSVLKNKEAWARGSFQSLPSPAGPRSGSRNSAAADFQETGSACPFVSCVTFYYGGLNYLHCFVEN